MAAVQARELQQAKFKSVGDALTSPQNAQLSTLLAAVKAADLKVPDDAAYTIFAPTNKAFKDSDVVKRTGLTAAQLLLPANKKALTSVLEYHIVPSAAVRSTQLKNGQEVPTALKGAAPLKISIKDGKVSVVPGANTRDAVNVVTADVVAGKSVIHVIDDVLIPPSLRKSGN